MRWSRLLAVVVLTCALVASAVLGTSPALAGGKPHRVFTYARIVRLSSGALSFRAHVAHYPNGFIALMKKTCATCTWQRVAIRRTSEVGSIVMQAPALGRWYWRYRTPETKTFAVTYSATWYTFRH